jgi:hypothetical protein
MNIDNFIVLHKLKTIEFSDKLKRFFKQNLWTLYDLNNIDIEQSIEIKNHYKKDLLEFKKYVNLKHQEIIDDFKLRNTEIILPIDATIHQNSFSLFEQIVNEVIAIYRKRSEDRSVEMLYKYFEIEAGVRGKVSQINMRSSVITTFDNIDIIIPNATLIQNNVINLTFSDDIRRLNIPFGIAYGCDIDYVIKTILESLNNSKLTYIRYSIDKAPKVRMTLMGASSINFELLVWISENPDENGVGSSNMSDFLIFIYKTLQENNIEIPFPQMDIHLKKEK